MLHVLFLLVISVLHFSFLFVATRLKYGSSVGLIMKRGSIISVLECVWIIQFI